MKKIVAPYGSWKSSITTDIITAKKILFLQLCIDGDDIYWIESRPHENGRYIIMRRTPDGKVSECTPPEYYVRSRVHEYGGGAFTVHKGVIYFVNFKDQHLYRQPVNGSPELLTPGDGYNATALFASAKITLARAKP